MMQINESNANQRIANKDIRDLRHSHEIRILASQNGSIIIFTVLILSSILAITLTLTRIFLPRVRSITEATDSIGAVYAADSAMEWCLYNNREKAPPLAQPVMSNGAAYQIYNNSTPSACPGGEALNYRTVGTWRGVSRSFEVSEL